MCGGGVACERACVRACIRVRNIQRFYIGIPAVVYDILCERHSTAIGSAVVALTFFRPFRLTFLRMRDKCKIINMQRNDKAFVCINATGCSLTLL